MVTSSLKELPIRNRKEEQGDAIRFAVTDSVGVSDSVVGRVKTAISMVLGRYSPVDETVEAQLHFVDKIINDKTGEVSKIKARYTHANRRYEFAMDRIREINPDEEEGWALFFAAHEATHMVRDFVRVSPRFV